MADPRDCAHPGCWRFAAPGSSLCDRHHRAAVAAQNRRGAPPAPTLPLGLAAPTSGESSRVCVDDGLPILPYAGTSGWSGGGSSRDRAARDDTSGVTGARQRAVLDVVTAAGAHGVTYVEAGRVLGLGHGAVSGALSVLHRAGVIARLRERRGGCEIYVAPTMVGDRETVGYRPARGRVTDEVAGAVAGAVAAIDAGDPAAARALLVRALEALDPGR